MPAPYEPHHRVQRRDYAHRLRYQAATHWWSKQDPKSLGTACAMTSIGAVLILGFILAVLNDDARFAGPLLLFGVAMSIFGGLLLLFALIEWVVKKFTHTKKYCGCCAFYKPQGDEYDLGLCLSDPQEGFVQRTHSCPYFLYSERAMVRDRLSQQHDLINNIRIIRVDSDQADSED